MPPKNVRLRQRYLADRSWYQVVGMKWKSATSIDAFGNISDSPTKRLCHVTDSASRSHVARNAPLRCGYPTVPLRYSLDDRSAGFWMMMFSGTHEPSKPTVMSP